LIVGAEVFSLRALMRCSHELWLSTGKEGRPSIFEEEEGMDAVVRLSKDFAPR
jgi:hypothetical protein